MNSAADWQIASVVFFVNVGFVSVGQMMQQ
jgi:hypothetical protein